MRTVMVLIMICVAVFVLPAVLAVIATFLNMGSNV